MVLSIIFLLQIKQNIKSGILIIKNENNYGNSFDVIWIFVFGAVDFCFI